MQVVYNDKNLKQYVQEAVEVCEEHPILIDQYIQGKEVEIDAISDGENILIPGVFEHIERTGVHSGDSISVYPTQNISQNVLNTIEDYSKKLARALRIRGLMNIQFIVKDEQVYIIEVNPRASRTVPIISKVTDLPMVEIATKIILGNKLKDMGLNTGILPSSNLIAVKVPVFSFQKLLDVDVALSPEMKSTGEVLGIDSNYEKALAKGFIAADYNFPNKGKVLVSLNENDKKEFLPLISEITQKGFEIVSTEKTYEFLLEAGIKLELAKKSDIESITEMFKANKIAFVLNTPTLGKDKSRAGFKIRNMTQTYKTPCFTSFDTAQAYLKAMDVLNEEKDFTYEEIDYYRRKNNEKESCTCILGRA